ncbi:hairy-related 1 [Electrophorus electricus]|uniref:hairy-related 1 n=1 Tax=Electrophorus electricus TaxID=8005 RepID=UPI0015CFDB32|nr:hairy-related 1 [Electrophorus electricus]
MGTPKMANRRTSKRILKPVIEKKRRDRINQRLDELRTLLLDNTLDSRLQNPKLEKAEILELTVDYIKKKASNMKEKKDSNKDLAAPAQPGGRPRLPCITLHDPAMLHAQAPVKPLYTAGFQECISRLASFIDCVEPSQRDGFIQGLCRHLDTHTGALSQVRAPSQPPPHPWGPSPELHCRTDVSAMGPVRGATESFPYASSLYPSSFVLHHPHTTGQAISHPYPSPPYSLSPPPSPCYSSTSPPFSTSPTYLSMPCHFPFPPSLSPLSSDSSSSCLAASTPAVSLVSVPQPSAPVGPPSPARAAGSSAPCASRTLRRALFQNQPQSLWRPW